MQIFDKIESWAITKQVKLNKDKHQILQLKWGDPVSTDRLGNEGLESSTMGRDLGLLVDGKFNMSWQNPGSQ